MIKCPSCGFSNDDNCTFCAICGSSVTQDDFYVHNTTNASFSVEDLTKKLISKDNKENGKTKSFKKLDKATIAREAAKIELENNDVKEYKGSTKKNPDNQNKKTTDNQKNTSENDVKSKGNENAEVKNSEVKQEVSAVNKDNKSTEKSKEATINTKVVETKKATKANTEEKKEEANNIEKKSKPTALDTKNEENQKSEINEETPDSAKGSTDGELYRILSRFFFDTKNETSLFKQDDIDENCSLAIISYIPFLFFIPMIIKPCSGYLRYHGIQGLTMFLSFVALEFSNIIMGAIFNSVFSEMAGVILTVIITVIINLTVLLLISIGIANAVKGAARELPIIGKYKLLKQYIY